jgi:hypothetical protein
MPYLPRCERPYPPPGALRTPRVQARLTTQMTAPNVHVYVDVYMDGCGLSPMSANPEAAVQQIMVPAEARALSTLPQTD